MQYSDLFFSYRFVKTEGEILRPGAGCPVSGEETSYAFRYARKVLAACPEAGQVLPVCLETGIPQDVLEAAGECCGHRPESYAVVVRDGRIRLYGADARGLIYAVSTFKQLLEHDALREMVLYDYPDKAVRGYRVFTPGRQSFDAFREMVDMLVEYKYNAIMIEIGGAMEYKRHPEINEKWVEFCEEVHQSPYEAARIQQFTHPWPKNSIHADNGAGSFITQEEMRTLIAYCRERGLEVIPEVPTLSHSDYIVMAHPDIREREADTYPDTYCPSNPKSYELVFDILDEILGVFQPSQVNIGHDECYTLAQCPLCRDKDPVDLFVDDIVRIHEYLKARGIRTIMWSEKFIDNVYLPEPDGTIHGYGGTGDEAWGIPRMIGCVGKIPTDVILLHWYWSLCTGEREKELQEMGYPMLYGNFRSTSLKDYRDRIGGVAGGFVSNWGAFEPEYMQRNGQNFGLLVTAWSFWSPEYTDSMEEMLREKVTKELYQRYRRAQGSHVIELLHTTDHSRPYKTFYDGYYIVPEDWQIGRYLLTYTDGTTAELPIIYGYNIRTQKKEMDSLYDAAEAKSNASIEAVGASCPELRDGTLFYRTAYADPYPEKQLQSIVCEPKQDIRIETVYDAGR